MTAAAATGSRTASGALANLAAQGLPFLLLLVVTPILLTALGRERYGVLVLFNLIAQIAVQLDFGIATAATRGFSQYSARGDVPGARRLFNEALVLLASWGVMLGVAFFAGHDWIARTLKLDVVTGDQPGLYFATALLIPLALINGAMMVPLRAVERYGSAARIQVIVGVVYWVACTVSATHGGTLTQLIALGTVTTAVSTIALHVTARRDTGGRAAARAAVPPSSGEYLLRPFLRLGAGAFVAQVSSLATYHGDKLLISALVSPAAAGAYAICTSVANKILLVIAASTTFTFPRSARLHAGGEHEAIANTFAIAGRLAMIIATAVSVPLIALAHEFLAVWIGLAFARDFAPILQVLVLGYAICATSVVASNVAIGIGQAMIPALFSLLGGAVTLLAVSLLAPRLGAFGAAVAATVGMTQALIFNAVIAGQLGPAARAASWPVVWRLVAVAIPIGVATHCLGTLVTGWASLLMMAAAAVLSFGIVWLSTFGRGIELPFLRRQFLQATHAVRS